MNLLASYTIVRAHQLHLFSVNFFNAGDNPYRNHLSFIKELLRKSAAECASPTRFSSFSNPLRLLTT